MSRCAVVDADGDPAHTITLVSLMKEEYEKDTSAEGFVDYRAAGLLVSGCKAGKEQLEQQVQSSYHLVPGASASSAVIGDCYTNGTVPKCNILGTVPNCNILATIVTPRHHCHRRRGCLLLLAVGHELLERFDPAGAHEVETLLPEGLVARVDAGESKDLGGSHGAAGLEDAVVDGLELLAFLQVLLVQRQDDELCEVVGVDVEGPQEHVLDNSPLHVVVCGDGDGITKHVDQFFVIDGAELIGGQLVIGDEAVRTGLEAVEHVLTECRGEGRLQLGAVECNLLLRVLHAAKQVVGDEHFAKDRGHFGEGQDGIAVDRSLLGGQDTVHAVSQFVRHGLHIAAGPGEVEHDPRMCAGEIEGAEGPTCLVGQGAAVDPVLVEELLDDVVCALIELGVRVQNDGPGVVPRVFVGFGADGRINVRQCELLAL